MKNEKEASVVLATAQYSEDDLTLYDKAIKAKKQSCSKKPSYIESLSFSSESNQFGPISYDLNTLDIDLNLRTGQDAEAVLDYASSSERFQALDAQYDFDCNFSKGSSASEIHAVADMILKREWFRSTRETEIFKF